MEPLANDGSSWKESARRFTSAKMRRQASVARWASTPVRIGFQAFRGMLCDEAVGGACCGSATHLELSVNRSLASAEGVITVGDIVACSRLLGCDKTRARRESSISHGVRIRGLLRADRLEFGHRGRGNDDGDFVADGELSAPRRAPVLGATLRIEWSCAVAVFQRIATCLLRA